MISGNVIRDEADDTVTNTLAEVVAQFNDLLGGKVGVDNLGAGTVDATENWWGNDKGPGSGGSTSVGGDGIFYMPFLTRPVSEAGN